MSNTVPDIFVHHDLHPEDNSMIQALYSRSPASVVDHLAKVEEVGSGKFMQSYYINYGHQSIGDCGSTTIFTENVSMLMAKAIEDNPLYAGQEASTRYLDFSQQPLYDPYSHPASLWIMGQWIELYNQYMPLVIEGLKGNHPFDPNAYKSEELWLKTLKVRAFDILRSLLPLGTTTLLSWHTNLRQARDHMRYMSHHPLKEVRGVNQRIFDAALEKYPHSFNGEELDPESERYRERNEYALANADEIHYLTPQQFEAEFEYSWDLAEQPDNDRYRFTFAGEGIANDNPAALNRPKGAPLPRSFLKYGTYNVYFLMDFGSFRDMQRQRNGYCPIPLVTDAFGFYELYKDELRKNLSLDEYTKLMDAIDIQLHRIATLSDQGIETNVYDNQYLYPMGMACGCMVTYSIPQMVYVAELRSGKTVHFTLRPLAQYMGRILKEDLPNLNVYVDYDEDSFSAKRGEQDIVVKEA